MTLDQLPTLLGCSTAFPLGATSDQVVTGVTEDSRQITPGSVFVAVQGEHSSGYVFSEEAVRGGATAIVGNRLDLTELHGVPHFGVAHPRKALGILAHSLAGDPSKEMIVIGVTGTNGKSSTVILVQHILRACGHPTACFGTLGYEIGGTTLPAKHTTPFGEELAEMFGRARDAKQTHVVMEVSSHSLAQDRVAGIKFDVAAFTNLTRDHLDYHKDMDDYCRAKLLLFEGIEPGAGRFTIVNRDDPSAPNFVQASRVTCHTYGTRGDCQAQDVRMEMEETRFTAKTPWGVVPIEMRLLGKHNVSNALCAIAICGGLGLSLEGIAQAIATFERIPGRFERVDAGQKFQVVVDYAHTDDGLKNVLEAAREVTDSRVIIVFGCGGDRDKGKRPRMGTVAATLADFSILTTDNPRSEDPERILLDIEVGVQRTGKSKYQDYVMILDRAQAIRHAIEMAKPGDMVLIAGKGHEDYQILGTQRIHFDDREVARSILEDL